MSMPFGGSPPVLCPTCADTVSWRANEPVFVWSAQEDKYVAQPLSDQERKRQDLLLRGYRRCPNPSADTAEHYLPARYGEYVAPLVVGMIGVTESGKTHLLTAMMRELQNGGLDEYGLQATPLDFRRHQRFTKSFVEPLNNGRQLRGTRVGEVEAADALLLRGNGFERPITFFDVAGEDLADPDAQGRVARFLLALNAAIFVHAMEDRDNGRSHMGGENSAFALATERIRAGSGGTDIPVSIALSKADRLRYVVPADRWLRRPVQYPIVAQDLWAESRDVYAYLHTANHRAALAPYSAFPRCTLHFVSASGGDSTGDSAGDPTEATFARGVRPLRVLQPLIAILAMSGMLQGREASRVGRW